MRLRSMFSTAHSAPSSAPEDLEAPSAEAAGEAPVEPTMAHFIFFGQDGLRAGWSLLAFVAVIALLGRALLLLLRTLHHSSPGVAISPHFMILVEGAQLLVVCAAAWVVSRLERRHFRSYGLGSTPDAMRQFLRGALGGVLLLGVLVGALWLTHLLVFTGVLLSGFALMRFAVEWAIGFLLVACFEEYALRGFVQFTLARGLGGALRASTGSPNASAIGFWIAAALLSFVFGFGHASNPGESPIGLLSAGSIGLVFCLSLWRTGSLWWAIGFHAAWDWMQSFVFGVADSGTMVQFHLLASHPQGRPLLSGGTTGPEGSLYILPITCAIAAVILLTLPQTRIEANSLPRKPAR